MFARPKSVLNLGKYPLYQSLAAILPRHPAADWQRNSAAWVWFIRNIRLLIVIIIWYWATDIGRCFPLARASDGADEIVGEREQEIDPDQQQPLEPRCLAIHPDRPDDKRRTG